MSRCSKQVKSEKLTAKRDPKRHDKYKQWWGEVLDRSLNRTKIVNKNQETSIMYGFNNGVSIFGSLTVRNVPYEC